MLRALGQVCLMILPWPVRRAALSLLFGYDIAPGARIGLSVISVSRLAMAEGARVHHLTLVKGLNELTMGPFSLIGNLNWITAVAAGNSVYFASSRRGSHASSLVRTPRSRTAT